MGLRRWLADPGATEALGRTLGERARPGTVFALVGDLGAGKSCLARGIARGLGLTCRIPSPTFVLVAAYEQGRLPLHHLDLYRLSDVDELDQLGLDDVLFGDGVCVVEWPERAAGLLGEALWITLSEHDDGRIATFEGDPVGWEALL